MTDPTEKYEHDPISVVAHDLKTPIAAVRGFLELVQQVGPLNDTQKRYAERALGGLDRMERLIANVLEVARLDSSTALQITRCDLQTIIEDAANLVQGLAEKRGIDIVVEVAKRARYVNGDSRLLEQVISNLLGNAIKYNRDNGKVFIKVSTSGDNIRVDVRDTGLGISEADQQRVFERFTRLRTTERTEGSGLGLAIAQTIVRKHGGRIWIDSVLGEGTTFSFTIPKQRKSPLRNEETSGESLDVVDDDRQETSIRLEVEPKHDEN